MTDLWIRVRVNLFSALLALSKGVESFYIMRENYIKVKKKIKKWHIVIFGIISLLIVAGVVFFQFTPIGYCMSVKYRNFTEVEHNIYVDKPFPYVTVNGHGDLLNIDDNGITTIVKEARNRVSDFFGGKLQSDPVIIISDYMDFHITYTVSLHKLFIYIAISHKYLNVDILAHEITHAELHYRVLNGKPFRSERAFIPLWFDEGLASINDYRKVMSEETWELKSDTTKAKDATKFTRADLYGKFSDDEFFNALIINENFLLCRHEVKKWIDKNGINALLRLIDGVRNGKDFETLYNE